MPDKRDKFSGLDAPAFDGFEITPSANDLESPVRGIYVGTSGDLEVQMEGGTTLIWRNFPASQIVPIRVKKVLATSTTATDIIGIL